MMTLEMWGVLVLTHLLWGWMGYRLCKELNRSRFVPGNQGAPGVRKNRPVSDKRGHR